MFPVVLPLRHLPVQIELIGTVTRKITVCVCVCLCVSVCLGSRMCMLAQS